jgi:hypothetical protein
MKKSLQGVSANLTAIGVRLSLQIKLDREHVEVRHTKRGLTRHLFECNIKKREFTIRNAASVRKAQSELEAQARQA